MTVTTTRLDERQDKTRQRGSRGRRHNSASMSGSQLSISKIQYKLLSNEISERFPLMLVIVTAHVRIELK